MKKYIIIILLIVFITPSIAFASWWNPFTWKIFGVMNKKETPTQIQKTIELQKPEINIIENKNTINDLNNINNKLPLDLSNEIKNKNTVAITPKKQDEKSTSEINSEKDLIREVFNNQIKSCKEGNIEKYYSYIYYGDNILEKTKEIKKMIEIEFAKVNQKDKNIYDMYKKMIQNFSFLPSYCSEIEFTFSDINIVNDKAALVVNAIINGQVKFPRTVFYIKDKNTWKQNTFGYDHPADGIAVDSNQYDNLCKDKGLFESSNMYNKETKEVFCLYDEPVTEDSFSLNVTKCENMKKSFRDGCYMSYAETSKNENYCKKVSIVNRQSCFEKLALIKKDMNVCKNLWEDTKCLINVKK